jgi:aconitase A
MSFKLSVYVVMGSDGKFFGGFNSAESKAVFVDDPKEAKKFTNKHDIKLRPDEQLVELSIDLSQVEVEVSAPFRPQRKPVK